MLNNLIIGSSSQIAQYMPSDYIRVSSRNINIKNIIDNNYNRIFLCFGEQRTCNKDLDKEFININFDYTLSLIDRLKNYCNSMIVYSTAELWNNLSGPINLNMEYNYIETPYIKSKDMLCKQILNNKNLYNNIHIIYPFNFNSIHRKYDSLFGKIFYSIIHQQKIEIGNINFNRDIIHTSTISKISQSCNENMIIGSGILTNIYKFVQDIFYNLHLDINQYLFINNNYLKLNTKKEFFSSIKYSSYNKILDLTLKDIKFYANQIDQ